jgi:hypothetical protein
MAGAPRKVGNDAGLLKLGKENCLMSDTEHFARWYERRQEALKQANAANKEAVFAALAEAGIATVTVGFDGEGDSGQLGDIAVDGKAHQLPDLPVEIQDAPYGAEAPVRRQATLFHAIETLCFNYLAHEHGGWENNDGAYGEFTFKVAHRRIELDFNARFSDSVNYTHTF